MAGYGTPTPGLHHAPGESPQRLVGPVRVDGRQGALVPGIQGLQEIEGLHAPDLADEDAIGPVPQRGPDQVADRDGRQPGLFAAGFEPQQVPHVQLQLRGVFDQGHAMCRGHERDEGIEERRLSGTGPAADQDVVARLDRVAQDLQLVRRQRTDADELLGGEPLALKLADGQRGATHTDRAAAPRRRASRRTGGRPGSAVPRRCPRRGRAPHSGRRSGGAVPGRSRRSPRGSPRRARKRSGPSH